MEEIEVKVIEVNKAGIEKKLKSLGAKKAFSGKIEAIIMDFPDKRLKKSGQILRLRKMTADNGEVKCILTHKHAKKKSAKVKTAKETEFEIGSFDGMKEVLMEAGLVQIGGMDKHRTSWAIGKSHVEIEEYLGKFKYVPCFLEIESPSAKEVYAVAKKIGIEKKDCLPWSSWDLVEYYDKKRAKK